ncbi:unnamed protein product [Haemonchus placei]|uniref:Ig-like domain-containing protein n=1 Tax=Haemonchus placei TaxID=6290 RepID=A0A3P7THI1_HAEPC|nr:unnamed protein product [Haemonchus placei]
MSYLRLFLGNKNMLFFPVCVENSEVFANTPGTGPYYVKPRSAGPTLKCSVRSEYSDPTRYQVQWQRYNKGDLRYVSIGNQLHDSTHFELIGDVSKGVYDLRLKDVNTDSVIGSYYCTVLDRQETQQYQADPIEVIALVPPSDPVITESPSQAVTAGDSVTFKCSSTGGSPPPMMSWTFLNGSTADERHVNTQLKGSTSESILHFRVRSEDNGAYVVCTVTNKAIEFEQPREARTPRLNVLFKPRVRVSPDQDLAIEAGHHIDLVCDADSNPYPPSYEWRHLALGEVYAASKWTVIASRNMSGDFECRAANSVGEGSAILTLNVQYAPSRYNPREGERVQIECSVDANPQAVDVKWSGPQGFISDGPLLVLKSVSREQTGNYTCTATNYLSIYGETGSQTRTGSATTIIDVQRPPGHADISPPRLNVIVGGTITLTCSTPDPGSPAGNFKWASPSSGGLFGTREHDHAQLTVRNAQLADNGRYRCRADNIHGEGKEAVVDVTVSLYKPNISKMSTASLPYIHPMFWKGNYSCRATNGADQKSVDNTSWTVMRVNHGPVVLNQRFPEEGLAAADIGTMAQLRCIISARPEPKTVNWVYNSIPIEENGRCACRRFTKAWPHYFFIQDDGTASWYLSFNLTGLNPLSSYYLRIRAKNKKGFSEFSPLVIATTNDVTEDPNMLAPSFLSFDLMRKSIVVEPRPPPDDCTLLYVSSGDTWRSAGCFSQDQPISDLVGGAFFRARFCSREHALRCSKMSHILGNSIGSPWRLALVVPAAVLALLVIIVCVLLVVCCRSRSPSKGNKKRYAMSYQLIVISK